MRPLTLAIILSLLLHTLILLNLSLLPTINLPARKAMVLTIHPDLSAADSLKAIKSKPSAATTNPVQAKNQHLTKADSQKKSPLKSANNTSPKRPPIPIIDHMQTQQNTTTIASLNQATRTNTTANQEQAIQGHSTDSTATSAATKGVAQVAGGGHGKIIAPKVIYAPAPAYPSAAEKLQQQGTVQAALQINVKGQVIQVSLNRSSGFSLLDNAAKRILKSWRFEPATKAGVAVPATTVVNILFTQSEVVVQ